jgi:hypothetical protein
VLAVGREGHVIGGHRAARADLGGLLAQQRGPDAELTLPLQCGRLDVPPADQREVAVETAQLLVADVQRVLGVLDALAFGCQQLDEVRLLREMRSRRSRYGVDHLGRLIQRSHRLLLAFRRGRGSRPIRGDGRVAAPGCGATHTW